MCVSHYFVNMVFKRTAGNGAAIYQSKLWRTSAPKRRKTAVPAASKGYLRRSGFYGRYSGTAPEKKFLDTTLAGTTVVTAGAIISSSLNVVPEGNGESARIGRKIFLTNLRMKGKITLNTANSSVNAAVLRCIVYQDTQTNGAAAGVTDILESADWRSWRNLANQERFKILKDKTFTMNPDAATITSADVIATAEKVVPLKLSLKINAPIEYDNSATTGAIATQRTNNIGVLAIASDQTCQIDYIARMRYKDT